MAAGKLDLVIEQGSTFRKTLTWKTGTPSVPVNLTGFTARLQFRTSPSAATTTLSLTDVASAAGQIILGGVLGTVEVYIKHTTTESLVGGGAYDLELAAPNTDVTRLLQGKYSVSPNITK